jgi:hypothetical protein
MGIEMIGPSRSIVRCAAVLLLCLQVAACTHYSGPITNARAPDVNGPPLLNGGFAP